MHLIPKALFMCTLAAFFSQSASAPPVVAVIAGDLIKGVVSGIGNQVGALIFGSIFEESVPSYFTEVYREIERIVHEEITGNTISEIDGQINGVANWVKHTYIPRKNSGASKQQLFTLLQPQVADVAVDMMGPLQHSSYAEAALSVFVVGASMHLILLQELAIIDPNAASPTSSSYASTISSYASQYARHAEDTYNRVANQRTGSEYITGVHHRYGRCSGGQFITTCERIVSWTDRFTGQGGQYVTTDRLGSGWRTILQDLENRANQDIANHKRSIKNGLELSLNRPQESAREWRKLISSPLP